MDRKLVDWDFHSFKGSGLWFVGVLLIEISYGVHCICQISDWFPYHLVWSVSFPMNLIPYVSSCFLRIHDFFDFVFLFQSYDYGWRFGVSQLCRKRGFVI